MAQTGVPSPAVPAAAPGPSSLPPMPLTTQQTIQTLAVQSGAATVFRHHDGNWHARVSFAIRNTGAEPVDVRRESFRIADMELSGVMSSFPDHVTINPGLTSAGDITWWRSATDPQPRAITVLYRPGEDDAPVLGTQAYNLVFAPTEPVPGNAPTAVVHTLAVTAQGVGLTFVHSDGNRHFRVNLQVRNTTTAPLRVYRDHFHALVGATEAGHASQSELTTWADPVVIAPGAVAVGSMGFWLNGDPSPNPTTLRVSFGPTVSPQAAIDAPVAPGPSPIP